MSEAAASVAADPIVVAIMIALGAALAAFVVQAFAGVLVVGFGGAIAALAIVGAAKSPAVKKVFDNLKTDANKSLTEIGAPFVGVMEGILTTADSTMKKLTPVFSNAAGIIAGPFKLFADTLITAFAQPAVQKAITAIAKAFGDILTAVTPQLSKDVGGIANDITAIANEVAAHPQAFADFISFLTGCANIALKAIDGLTHVAVWFETTLPNFVSSAWDTVDKDTKKYWDDITGWLSSTWNGIFADVKNVWNKIVGWFDDVKGWIEGAFKDQQNWLNGIGKNIITGLWNGLKAIWNSVSSWFSKIKGWIGGAFNNAGTWLWNAGYYVVEGLWNGMKNIWDKVTSWISGLATWIKNHKGPVSLDKTLLVENGEALMKGLHTGLLKGFANGPLGFVTGLAGTIGDMLGDNAESLFKKAGGKAIGTLKSAWDAIFGGGGNQTYKPGAGVGQWKGLVDQALKMLGLPTDLDSNVLYQMQTESGGNPNAINLWDSNAAAGDPSRGLMQVIGSTFAAYHVPGTSNDIYNPLANIAAAINYAKHVYGPNLANQYGGIGSGHGYAAGGPASGWAMVGEHGRELVRLPTGSQVYPNGATEAAQSGGGGGAIQLQVTGGQSDFEQFMVKMIKQYVRVHGGKNVQTAFGS